MFDKLRYKSLIMACCIRLGCFICITAVCCPVYAAAWMCSPGFRKKKRDEWASNAKEDEEFDKKVEEMTKNFESSNSRLGQILERAKAQERRERQIVAKYPEMQAKIKKMVDGGILEDEARRACVEQADQVKIQSRTTELIREGIPRLQASVMAKNEIQQQN
jgi:hypothetical protein